MRSSTLQGIAFRLGDLLLAGVAGVIVVALIGRGHGADDARDVVRAKIIVAGAFRLPDPEKPGAALLYVPEDGPASLAFHSSRGWSLSLASDTEGAQTIAFRRKGLLGRGSSFNVDPSGSPWMTVADLNTSANVIISAVGGEPSLKMVRASMSSIIVAGAGPNIAFPIILFIKAGTEEVRMGIASSSELTNVSLFGKEDGLKGQLGLWGASHPLPAVSLYHGKTSQVVQVSLEPKDRPFIRLNDQRAGTSRTLR